MHYRHSWFGAVVFSVLLLIPVMASAHQPRLVQESSTVVADPEVSKAYYGTLAGAPQTYRISATAPFDLYVNILVPDIAGQKKDVSAAIYRAGTNTPIVILGGSNGAWSRFWEPFGRNWYWQGAEYKTRADAGTYEIRVSSTMNDSKYTLAVGEIEKFDAKETLNAITLIPKLKQQFFRESPAGFLISPFGIGYVFVMFLLAFVGGFLYRAILKKGAKSSTRRRSNNIGAHDRVIRLVLANGLFALAILTSWSPWLLFFSGFCFFEAIFSWCGFYAALGKNTCPMP